MLKLFHFGISEVVTSLILSFALNYLCKNLNPFPELFYCPGWLEKSEPDCEKKNQTL